MPVKIRWQKHFLEFILGEFRLRFTMKLRPTYSFQGLHQSLGGLGPVMFVCPIPLPLGDYRRGQIITKKTFQKKQFIL